MRERSFLRCKFINISISIGLFIAISAFLYPSALAEIPHSYYSDVVRGGDGSAVSGASVSVYEAGTTTPAVLYKGQAKGATRAGIMMDLYNAPVSHTSAWAAQHTGRAAFDGNMYTYWICANGALLSSDQYIQIDLGEDRQLSRVYVTTGNPEYTIRAMAAAAGIWTTVGTAANLPLGSRGSVHTSDIWDFTDERAILPEGLQGGTATVNVKNPVGRYLQIRFPVSTSWGTASVREVMITFKSHGTGTWNHLYTSKIDDLELQANPITTGADGKFDFYIANGDYDIDVSSPQGNYVIPGITLINPTKPHQMMIEPGEDALTLVQEAGKTTRGNIPIAFDRPDSEDGNNPPVPYRFITHKDDIGWARTFNADWDEINHEWAPNLKWLGKSHCVKITSDDHAWEFENSYFAPYQPVMEKLFRVSPKGEVWTKATSSGICLEMKNNTGLTLGQGDVVVVDPDDPFAVIVPRKYADFNPLAVVSMGADNSRVYVLLTGRWPLNMASSALPSERLVTAGAGSLQVTVAPPGADSRAVIGRLHTNGYCLIP